MAKAPVAGLVKTRLCPPLTPQLAAGLYRCFLLDILELCAGMPGIEPVVAFAPRDAHDVFAALTGGRFALVPQEGQDLGARLENTFRALFSRGCSRVVALSSDSPDLPQRYLQEAFDRLEHVPVVFGPCCDGGYYLVGLSRMIPELFRDMPWSTDRVLSESLGRARALGLSVACLDEWYDVDTEEDLQRLVGELTAGRAGGRAPRTARFCRDVFQETPVTTERT